MTNKQTLEEYDLPITDINQLQNILSDFILWYDKKYCKGINGANEVVADYFSRYEPRQNICSVCGEGDDLPNFKCTRESCPN